MSNITVSSTGFYVYEVATTRVWAEKGKERESDVVQDVPTACEAVVGMVNKANKGNDSTDLTMRFVRAVAKEVRLVAPIDVLFVGTAPDASFGSPR